ncbi:MAG: sodium-dependent transporter [Gammaproteobacteria bacterium]|nr:sodium-dependent transporter [Gammaproteobacteria bacterium]
MARRQSLHGQWSSRLAFVLAATGAAVGLGNIWKFPYMTGENGGGAFVIIYLACVLAIGLPIFMAEAMLGRRGRRNPINTMKLLSEEEAGGTYWQLVGWMGVLAGVLILSYYSVIAGWTFFYAWDTATGVFVDADATLVVNEFNSLMASPMWLIFWHTIFIGLTVYVVGRGVEQGLEKAVKYLMPTLFALILVLVAYAMTTDFFGDAMKYMFQPDFSKVTAQTVLDAMGQAFFSLSLGMGAIMAYGAYLPDDASIAETSLTVVAADTSVALLAGLAIFPIVLMNGLDPGAGAGLVFQTLPLAFGHMPGGQIFGTIFFVLLIFAAWSSSIGLIEPAVARLIENHGMSRQGAAISIGVVVWFLGLLTVLSFNHLSDFTFLAGTIFDNLDFLTSNIMLPLGGLLIALFAGWVMCKSSSVEELELGTGMRYAIWRFLTRFLAPTALLVIFLNATGLLNFASTTSA